MPKSRVAMTVLFSFLLGDMKETDIQPCRESFQCRPVLLKENPRFLLKTLAILVYKIVKASSRE